MGPAMLKKKSQRGFRSKLGLRKITRMIATWPCAHEETEDQWAKDQSE